MNAQPAAQPAARHPADRFWARLHGRLLGRRQRRLLAAVEVLAAAVMVPLAVLAWQRASIAVQLPEFDNPAIPDFTGRMSGPWAAGAIAAVTAAGLLVLDALRQVLLAARGRQAEGGRAEGSQAEGGWAEGGWAEGGQA